MMVHFVLLSGGSGTRLWPLSNDTRSKQFLKVLRNEHGDHISMVQRVFSQLSSIDMDFDVTIATGASQLASLESQVEGACAIVVEPERRDTAPAIMLACANLLTVQNASPTDVAIVMPIDAYADSGFYECATALSGAVRDGVADIVLLGVRPTGPSEKFGYIVPGDDRGKVWPVDEFIEKPSHSEAVELIEKGALWNCGVFAFKLEYIDSLTKGYLDFSTFDQLLLRYSELPKNSFDYEVVEKAEQVAVIPYTGAWEDLGTWNALSDKMEDGAMGRVMLDEESCENVHAINETALPLVVAGISDAVVVATPDGILVSDKERSEQIKGLVAGAAVSRPMYEKRRWGEYRVLDMGAYKDGGKSLTKELVIKQGCQISYQRHAHRLEVWTVVDGRGEVCINGESCFVESGSVVTISPNDLHGVRALEDLTIIEVQLGDPLTEEDIERFGNHWD